MNEKIIEELKKFRDERKWEKFHTNQNLAKSISIEAAEILELFQWDDNISKEKLEDEIADVASYLYLLADKNNIDIDEAILKKININKKRFPVEDNQGVVKKHE